MGLLSREEEFKLIGRNENKCFFCQNPESKQISTSDFDGKKYSCPLCGIYSITASAISQDNQSNYIFYDKLASVAAEFKLKGRDGYTVATYSDPLNKIIDCQTMLNMFPSNFIERLDRTLWNIAKLSDFNPIATVDFQDFYRYYTFTGDLEEAKEVLKFLRDKGDITYMDIPLNSSSDGIPNPHLTLQGYNYIRKMQLGIGDGIHAFVAMWFEKNKRMDAFIEAVTDAVNLAGYECKIVNRHEHNNFIMDEVLNLIDQSKFVIADFTCAPEIKDKDGKIKNGVRGGVYFEAGYAKGKGKEIICTCADDEESQARRHFDIAQINTIFWKNEDFHKDIDSLTYRLYQRIIQTIGHGQIIPNLSIKNKYNWFNK